MKVSFKELLWQFHVCLIVSMEPLRSGSQGSRNPSNLELNENGEKATGAGITLYKREGFTG